MVARVFGVEERAVVHEIGAEGHVGPTATVLLVATPSARPLLPLAGYGPLRRAVVVIVLVLDPLIAAHGARLETGRRAAGPGVRLTGPAGRSIHPPQRLRLIQRCSSGAQRGRFIIGGVIGPRLWTGVVQQQVLVQAALGSLKLVERFALTRGSWPIAMLMLGI